MSQLSVHHFGPDPAYVGGMGSVVRVLTDHRVGADVVVSHPTWRPKSRFASVPLALVAAFQIFRMRQSEIAHVHLAEKGSFIREGGLAILARLCGQITVVTIHGSNFLPFARRRRWLVARVLRRAHLITCLDQDVLAFIRDCAPNVHAELLPNPVPIDKAAFGADTTDEIVLFAGEIGLRKGADVLSEAWRLVAESRPNARCIMVGPVKDYAIAQADRLEVRPPVQAAAMRDLLRSARVVALPSRAEGMPMVLTEAMSSGRPFVSTPVGGIPSLAQAGGVLVPVEDHVGLARALIEFLAEPEAARRQGEQGQEYCSQTRSVEVVGERLRGLYLNASSGESQSDSPREVLLVASNGGHLLQLLQLADLWPQTRRHWVTFRTSDAVSLLAGETTTWAYHPTNRNVRNLIRNLGLALRIVRRHNLQAIVTTGAGVAVPFVLLGRLFGVNVVYIESMARITSPSLTGRLVYPFADTFIVQWPALQRYFKRALLFGTVFDPS
jgi:glycosyltransferase involved in cell wall biosynthesis